MREAEHVAGLVREHFAAAPQQQCLIIRRAWFAIKYRIVSGKAVNADTIVQRSLPEDEIPRRLRIKVFHRDRENAEGVRRNARFKEAEDITGEDLWVAGVWIATRGQLRVVDLDWRKCFHFHREECVGKFL